MTPRPSGIYNQRGLIMVPPLLFALLCTSHEVENGLITVGLGGGLFVLGLVLRTWSQMHLQFRLKSNLVLTTTGPYQYSRNPIYIANTLIMLGMVCMSELVWFMPLMLLYAGVMYTLVVREEERYLRARYGQPYEEYLQRVPRWLPMGGDRHRLPGQRVQWQLLLGPSLLTEMYNFAFLIPPAIKEIVLCRFGR